MDYMAWNGVECHGIPWDTEDCHSFNGFYAISMAFQWNYMESRWNAVEFHGIQKIAIVSMLFPWHLSGIIWHSGGMLWNSMGYKIFLTV